MKLVLLEDLNKRKQMMTRQDQDNSHTPRGIEKTEKGKRAHACGFPGELTMHSSSLGKSTSDVTSSNTGPMRTYGVRIRLGKIHWHPRFNQ
ncbi:hypothetical protein N7467_007418 [Penicillium canescens]|nr:hypothetical protein N7467_007418 [Penicillium canescens]